MAEIELENPEENQAVFNMALDTLKRLGKILEEVKYLQYKKEYSIDVLQSIKIGLIKQFFVQASPLLPETVVEKYKKEILGLKSKHINVIENRCLNDSKNIGTKLKYDEKLEIRLDEILIELQMILQKEKYFMPSEEEGDF